MTGPRVLLVDDEFSGAEVLGLILSGEGYHVTVAADGRQALARLDEAAPDLLVTDFMMPGMNGAQLVAALREMPLYRTLPVLLISGAPEAALRAYRVSYQRFLRKPFGLDEFLAAVGSLQQAT
jgi:CheY-like chemotaxis protein